MYHGVQILCSILDFIYSGGMGRSQHVGRVGEEGQAQERQRPPQEQVRPLVPPPPARGQQWLQAQGLGRVVETSLDPDYPRLTRRTTRTIRWTRTIRV